MLGIIVWIFNQIQDEVPVSAEVDGNCADDESSDDHDEPDSLQRQRIQQRIRLKGCEWVIMPRSAESGDDKHGANDWKYDAHDDEIASLAIRFIP